VPLFNKTYFRCLLIEQKKAEYVKGNMDRTGRVRWEGEEMRGGRLKVGGGRWEVRGRRLKVGGGRWIAAERRIRPACQSPVQVDKNPRKLLTSG
jgi:hypothetical protein